MKTKKRFYFLMAFFLFATTMFGQTNPPPVAMPMDSAVILVDKIIEVTKHEEYFVEYCVKKVKKFSIEDNWTIEKTNQVLKGLNFENYNSTIYNSYAFYSMDQLRSLLNALILLNKDPKSSVTMVLTNSMMQSNLDLYIDEIIKRTNIKTK